MLIKVLGSGRKNCNTLEERTREAASRLGIDAQIEHVNDMVQIMGYGVMSTPALVVDEELKLSGRVPSVDEIAALLGRA